LSNVIPIPPPHEPLAEGERALTTLPWYRFLSAIGLRLGGPSPLGWLNLRDYGATGNGVTDDTTAIEAWLGDIATQGITGYAPEGTYMTTGVDVDIAADVHVVCDNNAIFKHVGGASVLPVIHLDGLAYRPKVSWRGGQFDSSLVDYSAPFGSLAECLEVIRCDRLQVSGARFYAGAAAASDTGASVTGGGDSGIVPIDVKDINITDCYFQGFPDLGIYITGGSLTASTSDDAGEAIVTNCHFYRCTNGISSKRQSRRTLIANNILIGINNVAISLYEAGPSTDSGTEVTPTREGIIANNHIYKSGARAIDVHSGVGTVVAGNVIKDFGYQWDGTTAADTLEGIRLFGVLNASVTGNTIGMETLTNTTHVAVHLNDHTVNTVVYPTHYCNIAGNNIYNCASGFVEGAGTGGEVNDPNYYIGNTFTTVTTKYDFQSGSNSVGFHAESGFFNFAHPVKFEKQVRYTRGNGGLLTIASGAVTATQNFHTIDTESSTTTDDLDTINGGNDGAILYLSAASGARTVVLKDLTGNIDGPGDITLDNAGDMAHLIFNSASSTWRVVSFSDNGA
jgi:hypothetical protein